MGYERSISAPEHAQTPETVWKLEMPRIRFGRDAVEELDFQFEDLGVEPGSHGLLVTDETLLGLGHAERVREQLGEYELDVYDGVEREPSIAAIEDCISFVRDERGEAGYDFYVGLGGGSCIDTAKTTRAVIANGGQPLDYVAEPTGKGESITESGPPLVLMPTTAGTGAEISPVAILSVEEKGIKEGISSDHIRADAAVLDPTLTTTLPPEQTAKTAMDALGHAIEGYTTHSYDSLLRAEDPATRPVYAGRTPVTEMFSEKAIHLLSSNVRRAVHNGDDLEARENMLQGALMGAISGLTAGATLCHAMAYPVGNRYHTYHGETIAALTPASTLGYNAASDPERFADLAQLFGVDTTGLNTREAADALKEEYIQLQRDLNVIPSGLAELAGIDEDDIGWLATQTVETQQRLLRCNPRPVTEADVEGIFREALYNWE
ncbi:hydroxyacid-oxoacid transhydrogenase [Halalkalicoccus jeotgali]|uniref:hydroxyacid-oxoacid transhydrogenase n=1 Tax=Halalkalicoccus jeotgali (strain DSM 18796 / CECT 7217 / JCM 14584 / KCTC 4019 / B3) TaxID=795797 RepID=D8J7X7_HALJB|nr:hydroxyacid-oxoacid transhydrogenase [Halalkalicoccus jeotgali]ADJ14090.1 iron-containing alcohol dehydrogenase [Halalkalicoccus jeotgali B3]ELY34480.1 iron-containing alcohol dehydrogenase [Halalkalicoccus jeotgali B3]